MVDASRSYTDARTQVASVRARCDTQAPFSMKASAAATCSASSRVTSLTSTFVSIARMARLQVPPYSSLHLLDGPRLRRLLRKQCAMDIFGRVAPRARNDDPLAVLVPLEDR